MGGPCVHSIMVVVDEGRYLSNLSLLGLEI